MTKKIDNDWELYKDEMDVFEYLYKSDDGNTEMALINSYKYLMKVFDQSSTFLDEQGKPDTADTIDRIYNSLIPEYEKMVRSSGKKIMKSFSSQLKMAARGWRKVVMDFYREKYGE